MASANDIHETLFQLPDLSGLSDEERTQLLAVMKKAQEFEVSEEKQLMRQPLEGLLYKYTNVMKGWQYRWFVLNPELGRLEYYEKEEHKKLLRPRGSLTLANATVCPSDEDSQTFYVNASNGESFRLKAFDAKERQHWVNRLRATAEYHSEISGNNLILAQTSNTNTVNSQRLSVSSSTATKQTTDITDTLFHGPTSLFSPRSRSMKPIPATNNVKMTPPPPVADTDGHIDASLKTCIDSLTKVRRLHKDLTGQIEILPASGEVVCCLDKEMLLLKATSNATIACLEQCLAILQRQAATVHTLQSNGSTLQSQRTVNSNTRSDVECELLLTPSVSQSNAVCDTSAHTTTTNTVVRIKRCDEVQDSCIYTDTDLDGVDEHKTVILHLLSQLKLGMDLTKVVLPTFILEKRSLLEMFADCMAHPELFLRITDEPTAEARMLAVVEWYLTSFHAGRQGSVAKKPYNPIIGEYFHCSWSLPSNSVGDLQPSSDSSSSRTSETSSSRTKLYYCAEQVSHHPPISAFYFESPEKEMYMDASFWTRSKFMGMSIGVALIGRARLRLLSPGGAGAAASTAGSVEEYEFSLPSVYARSILTVPWVELGDKVTIHCEQTGYSAAIVFHTKPFYGGRLHKVTGEVKNGAGDTVTRIAGEWNSTIEFTLSNGLTRTIDTSQLAINCKFVRPVDIQDSMESRRLWRHVTDSLRNNDIDQATEHKRILEDAQREGERLRKESRLPFPTKYFHRVDDEWVFKSPLQPTQTHPSV